MSAYGRVSGRQNSYFEIRHVVIILGYIRVV